MKKIIIMLTIVVLAATSYGQTHTVYDTVQVDNAKWQIVNAGIEKIETNLTTVFDREKVKTGTMSNLTETKQLLKSLNTLANNYSAYFVKVDTITFKEVDGDYFLDGDTTNKGIIEEYQELNGRVQSLQSDSDIKYLDAVSEFKIIQNRKLKLKSYYDKINK